MIDTVRDDLVALSHELGRPENDYAILGEGNTSARADDESFWVKASGSELRTLRPAQLVRVGFAACHAMVEGPALSDAQITEALLDAVVEGESGVRPSVETVLHAALLQLDGVVYVGHTHPTAINAVACSNRYGEDLARRLFPDQVVICGPSAALVPYVDPGLPLANEVLLQARRYLEHYGEPPKTIYLQNHGFIALGKSAKQVAQITAMSVKAARILLGSYAADGPKFMACEHVARIAGREDEHYRQRILDAPK
ncbi:MAG: class II aldolase/adducin family protein [Planctomycetota bacterium]